MQRTVDRVGQQLIGGDGHEHVGSLHADLELVKVVILKDGRMAKGALDHGLRTRLAVALQQLALQRAGVDADPHRAAVVAGGLDDVNDPIGRADVAGIDPQARRAGLRRLDAALVVKMDVGDQGEAGLPGDRLERGRRVLVGTRHAHDVGPGLLELADLFQGRGRITGDRVGHRLHGDRRITPYRNAPDVDLAALPTIDGAPGAQASVILNGHESL